MGKSNSGPDTRVLSDTIEDAIGGRRVKTALFLTYQFDPGFFETQVLRLLFSRGFSEKENIRRVQIDEELRKIDHLAVFYDRRELKTEGGSARLDYKRIGVGREWGVFHPKNVILIVEKETEGEKQESLILVTTSANLTKSGWWENVEVAHVMEIKDEAIVGLREDFLGRNGLINLLRNEDKTGDANEILDTIRAFFISKTYTAGKKSSGGTLHPRFFVGNQRLPEFITEVIVKGGQWCYMEVISPFFDNTKDAKTLDALIKEINPIETRILLPRGQDGAALCESDYYNAVKKLKAEWSELPGGITRWSEKDRESAERYVHAKVIRLFSPSLKEEFILSGSPNLTGAAHSANKTGNFETAVLTGGKVDYKPDWWLTHVVGKQPSLFRVKESDEPSEGLSFPNVSFRYDWKKKELSYFWEEEKKPSSVEVRFGNVVQFIIDNVKFGKWVVLGGEQAAPIEERLKSSSFLEVWVDGLGPYRVLVREDGMGMKPALFYELSAEDILEYWSLLSPEQRDAFLDRKMLAFIDQALAKAGQGEKSEEEAPESMFDRFAGIFHAFSCLQEYVSEAIKEKRHNEASYRLFALRHDTLPNLINKVTAEEEGDRVNRYVRLMCAKETLEAIKKEHPSFYEEHKQDFKEVFSKLYEIEKIKAGFEFDSAEKRQEFFKWFEDMFAMEVEVPEEEATT